MSSDLSNSVINSHTTISSTATISSCVFQQCSTLNSGGAISSTATSINILIYDSAFISCQASSQAGSIFDNGASVINLTRCCTLNCSSVSNGVDLIIYVANTINIVSCSFSLYHSYSSATFEGQTFAGYAIQYSQCNASKSYSMLYDGTLLFCNQGGSASVRYTTFYLNSATYSVLGYRGTGEYGVESDHLNVVGNSAAIGCLFEVQSGSGHNCSDSVIVGNTFSATVGKRYDIASSDITFYDCALDSVLSSLSATASASGCSFGPATTVAISLYHSQICAFATARFTLQRAQPRLPYALLVSLTLLLCG